MSASLFSLLFLAALGLGTALHLWLQARQIRHVRTHRAAVPAEFAESIPLESHQRSQATRAAALGYWFKSAM